MSWSEDYVRDLRGRLAEAKRQGLFLSALDVAFFRHLVAWWGKASMQGWARPNDGMLPTIAWMREQGVSHVFVYCERHLCHQSRRIALDDLYRPPGRMKVPEHAIFRDLPNICRFRCLKCGSRHVSIMAQWPAGPGMGGAHGQQESIPLIRGKAMRDDEG